MESGMLPVAQLLRGRGSGRFHPPLFQINAAPTDGKPI
jgi:hypothetical protein